MGWTTPDHGGLPILNYTLALDGAEHAAPEAEATQALVQGLQGNTDYVLELRARSDAGLGERCSVEVRRGALPVHLAFRSRKHASCRSRHCRAVAVVWELAVDL